MTVFSDHSDLLERSELLSQFNEAWVRARRGDGQFVLLGGEAGVGKTSVVRAFVETVDSGVRVLTGMCEPYSTPRPLAPLFDMAAVASGLRSLGDDAAP